VLFRKSSAEAGAPADAPETIPDPAGKGRPTPTRKEAEALRRRRAKAPLDRRSAARAQREEARLERGKVRQALATGDQRYLPARDKGPVRAFARDYVDARRTVGELMLPAMGVLVAVTLLFGTIRSASARATIVEVTYLVLIIIFVGLAWTAGRVKREAQRRFPDESVRGVGLYAALRSTTIRRWRMPRPRVGVGDTF